MRAANLPVQDSLKIHCYLMTPILHVPFTGSNARERMKSVPHMTEGLLNTSECRSFVWRPPIRDLHAHIPYPASLGDLERQLPNANRATRFELCLIQALTGQMPNRQLLTK